MGPSPLFLSQVISVFLATDLLLGQPDSEKHWVQRSALLLQGSMKGIQVAGMIATPALVNPPPIAQEQKAERQGGGPLHAFAISPTVKTMIWVKAMMAHSILRLQQMLLKNLPPQRES